MHEIFETPWNLACMAFQYDTRGLMEVPRPRVVAEPRPVMQDLIDRRLGKLLHGREAHSKALEKSDNGRDSSLLQHDFGNPYAIR